MSTNPAERQTREQRRGTARAQREAAEAAATASAARRKRLLQLLAVLAGAAIIVVGAVAISSSGGGSTKLKQGQKPPGTAEVTAMFAGIPEHGTALGNPKAPLTMHEFADLKCPICRQYSETILPTLVDRYVRPGKLRIVFEPQHFVGEQFNPGDSGAAATYALAAARQNRMWPFNQLFYKNQQDETTRYVTDDFLRQISSGVPGLNADRALRVRNNPSITRELNASQRLFESNGFTGTPSFSLGKTGGTQKPIDTSQVALEQFTGAIDQQLGQ